MPGAEPRLPATLGGEGWLGRTASHGEDLAAGQLWRACGNRSETGRLRRVALARPPVSLAAIADPQLQLLLRCPDLQRLQAQFFALKQYFESAGVAVDVLDDAAAPPNILFMRDLFFMTPEGAIVARPASRQRAGEARLVSRFLADLGIPILLTVHADGLFEGADALWIAPDHVLIGIGRRSNASGAAQVSETLARIGVKCSLVDLPPGVQHLLGSVNFLSPGKAVYNGAARSPAIEAALSAQGIACVVCTEREEIERDRVLNFVAIDAGHVIAPAGGARTRAQLQRESVRVDSLDVSEYLACAGGIGCSVGILARDPPAVAEAAVD